MKAENSGQTIERLNTDLDKTHKRDQTAHILKLEPHVETIQRFDSSASLQDLEDQFHGLALKAKGETKAALLALKSAFDAELTRIRFYCDSLNHFQAKLTQRSVALETKEIDNLDMYL